MKREPVKMMQSARGFLARPLAVDTRSKRLIFVSERRFHAHQLFSYVADFT
jgi:hypothetical protein